MLRLRGAQAFPRKVRVLRNLVLPHHLYSLRLEDLRASLGALAIIQHRREHLHILRRLRESARATAVEQRGLVRVRFGDQRLAVDVVARLAAAAAAGPALVHRREVLLHLRRWEHGHVFEAEWLDDALLDQVVELGACRALEDDASPVDVDAVFPFLTGLVDERHAEDVALVGMEDVEADGAAVVSEFGVEAVLQGVNEKLSG